MTRKQLAKVLAAKTKLTNKQAEDLIINFGNIVGDTLAKNKKIVYSNFGTFYTVHYPSKIIYHPKLGKSQKMVMLPTDVAKWMPSENIKKMVDLGVEVENATVHGRKNIKQPKKNPAPADEIDETTTEEEIEVPIKINHKPVPAEDYDEPIGIYEERMNDGSKFESTFSDAIRIRRPKTQNFFRRVFGKKNDEEISTIDTTKKDDEEIPINSFQKQKPIAYIDLANVVVPTAILQKIPKEIATRYKIVPVNETEFELTVAMADPENIEAKEIVKKITGKNLIAGISSEADINRIIEQYSELKETESYIGKKMLKKMSDNAPAARILTSLLRNAVRDKASDIHIEPKEKEVEIRYRIDGALEKKSSLPKNIQTAITARIKMLAEILENEFFLPQDGRFCANIDDRQIDFYVSTIPVTYGEKIVIKISDKENNFLKTEQLGIEKNDLKILNDNLKKTRGMILVCGPAQSGKTTTLYSLIDKIYCDGIDIVTLEDPIEYKMPGINQSQINTEASYTFASGLRSIIRQDPDIIMLGEINNSETAKIATQASLAGRTIFSTLYAKSATDACEKLLKMGIEPFVLASSLNCVVGQRLVKKICPDCKEEDEVSSEIKKQVQKEIAKMPEELRKDLSKKPLNFYRGHGCKKCDHSGTKGRIGLFEILNVNENIKNSIIKNEPAKKLQEKAIANKTTTIVYDGIIKALSGQITIEEVWRTIKE